MISLSTLTDRTMKIVLLGVSHKTALVSLRERLAIAPADLAKATRSLLRTPGVREALILSTCNRVELVTCQEDEGAELLNFLQNYFGLDAAEIRPHTYEFRDEHAICHLFRVAASLDSMVIGEPQILGQMKDSYRVARSVGATGPNLDRLLQNAFSAAKRVRNETQIGNASVSIASVAAGLAKKIFGTLQNRKVLLVGSGKMSELSARHLLQQGVGSLFVSSRTYEHAAELAQQFHGEAVHFEELYSAVDKVDVVITSTGSSQPLFRSEEAEEFLHRRRGRPICFIDISVPRSVDSTINRLDGVFLYDIDDLESIAGAHLAERSKQAELAESLIQAEVERFRRRFRALDVAPEIMRLQSILEDIRQAEVQRLRYRLVDLSPEQHACVEALTKSLVNKFLHHPLQAIKAAAREDDSAAVEIIRQAFGLHLTGRYSLTQDPDRLEFKNPSSRM